MERSRRRGWFAAIPVLLAAATGLLLAHRSLDANRGLVPGERLPDAELFGPDGQPEHTREWVKRATLLVMFRSSCPACLAEQETLSQIAPMFPSLRIAFVAVDGVTPGKDTPFRVLLDPTGDFIRRARRFSVPALYWIDPSGIVRYARLGPLSAAGERATLQRLESLYCPGKASPVRSHSRAEERPAPAGEELILQTTPYDCGVAALGMILASHGVRVEYEELQRSLAAKSAGTTMQAIKDAAERRGLACSAWRLAPRDLDSIPLPALVLLQPAHFAVLDGCVPGGECSLRDPSRGRLSVARVRLVSRWGGETLLFRPPGGAADRWFPSPASN